MVYMYVCSRADFLGLVRRMGKHEYQLLFSEISTSRSLSCLTPPTTKNVVLYVYREILSFIFFFFVFPFFLILLYWHYAKLRLEKIRGATFTWNPRVYYPKKIEKYTLSCKKINGSVVISKSLAIACNSLFSYSGYQLIVYSLWLRTSKAFPRDEEKL